MGSVINAFTEKIDIMAHQTGLEPVTYWLEVS